MQDDGGRRLEKSKNRPRFKAKLEIRVELLQYGG